MLTEITLPLAPSASVDSIAVMQWGDPNGRPLLFVHGWLDNVASFMPLSQELTEYNCLAIDLPGHGLSPHKQGHYHFIDWVDDLYQIIAALYQQALIAPNSQKLSLVGHSLGALISSVFAATFPDKIEKLVMIEGIGPLCSPEEESVKLLRRSVLARSRLENKQKKVFPSIAAALELWQVVSELDSDNAGLIVKRNLKAAAQGWQWQYDQRLSHRSPLRMHNRQAQYFCSHIVCPVLLLKANKGSYISAEHLEERRAWFNNLRVRQLGQGHHLHMGSPQRVAEQINEFISD